MTDNARSAAKRAALRLCRGVGLFALARRLTRRRLRILCYHGIAIGDQHEYAPVLFMRPITFERRLALLAQLGYPVLTLEAAVEKLRNGEIQRGEVVITIDDGWKSTATLAAPLLARYQFPACLYLTTYYVPRDDAIFNVVVHYLFWRTARDAIRVHGVTAALDGDYQIAGNQPELVERWVTHGERFLDANGRRDLLCTLARLLDIDLERALQQQRFALIDPDDIAPLMAQGIDIQLHTHRHHLPSTSFAAAAREITDNRAALQRLGAGVGRHFCYPSGEHATEHPAWLERLGITSATTCEAGLNDARSSPFLLRRYLDRDDATDVEFEAELCGFADILRGIRNFLSRPPQPSTLQQRP